MSGRKYQYPVLDYRIIDGDTVEVVLDRGWSETKKTALRINGIDAPESRTRRALEKKAGLLVKRVVQLWIVRAGQMSCCSEEKPKYAGRTVGSLYNQGGSSLGSWLIGMGLVKRYAGGKRAKWKDTELRAVIAAAEKLL